MEIKNALMHVVRKWDLATFVALMDYVARKVMQAMDAMAKLEKPINTVVSGRACWIMFDLGFKSKDHLACPIWIIKPCIL